MYIAVPILMLLSVTAAQDSWEYTVHGNTVDGQPCLSNCKNGRCIFNWGGGTKECFTNNQPAPKFRTAQLFDKNSRYCLTNCGYFGYAYQWCVTVQQGWRWDACNAEQRDAAITKKLCTGKCIKGNSDYYWCFVDNGRHWQYCAPAREGDEPDFELKPRTLETKNDIIDDTRPVWGPIK